MKLGKFGLYFILSLTAVLSVFAAPNYVDFSVRKVVGDDKFSITVGATEKTVAVADATKRDDAMKSLALLTPGQFELAAAEADWPEVSVDLLNGKKVSVEVKKIDTKPHLVCKVTDIAKPDSIEKLKELQKSSFGQTVNAKVAKDDKVFTATLSEPEFKILKNTGNYQSKVGEIKVGGTVVTTGTFELPLKDGSKSIGSIIFHVKAGGNVAMRTPGGDSSSPLGQWTGVAIFSAAMAVFSLTGMFLMPYVDEEGAYLGATTSGILPSAVKNALAGDYEPEEAEEEEVTYHDPSSGKTIIRKKDPVTGEYVDVKPEGVEPIGTAEVTMAAALLLPFLL